MRWFWQIFLNLSGWTVNGRFPYELSKYIVVVAPHTSNWDFVYGVAFRSVLRITHVRFLGKAELFRGPFGFLFRWLGGYPVDRKSSHNMVDQVTQFFNSHNRFAIAMSPEGTRKKVDRLRTGFYFIAKQAEVPLILAALDYENKQVIFREPLYVTGNIETEMEQILSFFRKVKGKNPEKGMMHL